MQTTASLPIDEQLKQHAASFKNVHLRQLLCLQQHCKQNLVLDYAPQIIMDYSRQHVSSITLQLLLQLAKERHLDEKIHAMASGHHINNTENRAVLHMALRANPQSHVQIPGGRIPTTGGCVDENRLCTKKMTRGEFTVDGVATNTLVEPVLEQIKTFSTAVRDGTFVSPTNKEFKHFVVIGIGGSFLGTQFVYEALRYHPEALAATGSEKTLHFVANVDPVDVTRVLTNNKLDYQQTLFIIVSKTFTTAETLMNAKVLKNWLLAQYDRDEAELAANQRDLLLQRHFVACSTAVAHATAFGVDEKNIFPFWDWVGGRYSVTSCVGMLPLSLLFGFDLMTQFLAGCHDMDYHFMTAPLERNMPVLLGLIGVWNSQYMGHATRTIAPYSETLGSFVAHIQQVDMESNGKRCDVDGNVLPYDCGEIDFGIPGTNSQHSFFQLLHQGRPVPADFLGFVEPQANQTLEETAPLHQHDELMCNFFAQPDALAYGTPFEDKETWANMHKYMPGNRPSTVVLFKQQTFYTIGLLLSLYEHRTAVQGFIWDINSFDQWGVQLGKVLATNVRKFLLDKVEAKKDEEEKDATTSPFKGTTQELLQYYIQNRTKD